ncbi:NADH-quinone oxidoreductase subunit NuoG [Candidatus Manganitrophus noduliformans]|uniref:NADH-quinone oxidoreductase n=1 Tax=Candidatus Manganitrophus noduliformans TaxID=2606439 RepID=A0A7X6DQG9_9BACT|nr:NADH-quinone oxidoreductase subunit NuoG [Candidatus Manganitrophus noduliformans]NKE71208.1 NADH-quinone oxidoreductase subunit NuoG [Candidatus Manganitrophus noduliformans]
MATIYIDNTPYPVNPSQNVLQNVLGLGLNLEYFCWHPAMGSIGACRQCAVKAFKDENDTNGKIVMACMTPASDGTRISILHPEAKTFRASVIEGLMLNHPHDCPVCDEGGECHLQDMTVMTGHVARRYRFRKRTFRNQYLGPLLEHEMNRCIQCYRCVRFYRDYAGGRDLYPFHLRNTVYFGRKEDGVLENEFSGNLDEVCPTGVFKDATYGRHYVRKWDLESAPSVCFHCGLGCNISPGERYGTLRRNINRYNPEVNGYFLCDRGRYGYEHANSPQRIREPLLVREGKTIQISKREAVQHLGTLLRNGRVIGIGSPRASLEANFALRTAVGPDRFFAGMADKQFRLLRNILDILRTGPAHTPSLAEMERADAIFILGEDVTNVTPRMALSLRQAVRQRQITAAEALKIPSWNATAVRDATKGQPQSPLFIAAPAATRLDEVATETYRAAPEDLARLGAAVAHAVDPNAPAVPDLPPSLVALADRIARSLMAADRPLVVTGMSLNSETIIRAAANIASALYAAGKKAGLTFAIPESNTIGLGLLGGRLLDEAFQAVRNGEVETVLLLENDLTRRADGATVDAFLGAVPHLVTLDLLHHSTSSRSELVLPVGSYAESTGTLVNNEGRAQRFFKVFIPKGEIKEGWRWLRDGLAAAGREEGTAWQSLDDLLDTLAREIPTLAGARDAAPPASFRIADQKLPRESFRFSGRTAIHANENVHEPKPPEDPDSPFAFSMEGYWGPRPPSLTPLPWTPGWNSNQQATIKLQGEAGEELPDAPFGVRLIAPPEKKEKSYFGKVPAPFAARTDQWLLVPRFHLFGSEELTRSAPTLMSLAPSTYIALRPDDAKRLQIEQGEDGEVELEWDGRVYPLLVRIDETLPKGLAAVPAGIPPFVGVPLPAWGRLRPAAGGRMLRMAS